MRKLEAIAFGVALIALTFLAYTNDFSTFISHSLTYIFTILFLGSSIAPELKPKAFQSPRLFQFGVGLTSGILIGHIYHTDQASYLAIIAIFICIAILAPIWIKTLEYL